MLLKFSSVCGKLYRVELPNNTAFVLSCVRLVFKMAGKRERATKRTCVEYIIARRWVLFGLCNK